MVSGDENIITFETRDDKMYVGDVMVNDYIANVWQTLHVDADTNTGKAKIYVNGKYKTTVDFDAEYFDGVKIDFAPDKDAVMWFDDIEVYEYIKHDDYPSAPQVAESTDYNVGMNVCWLWRDQQSGEGWDAVSPFMEFDTYLGYYEEGVRETADWELKWMAEHGVDFVHVCWYAPSENVQDPIKEMRHSYAALHDGYMMAEYSDLIDFCIMWENNSVDVYSLEQFQEYIWKYWCEYYFADERYATLDNKAIISVWNKENLETAFGGKEGARAAMEWMEEDIKRYGYDGIVFLAQTQGQVTDTQYQAITDSGFDATYAYHWKERGQDEKYQVRCNNYNAEMSSGISHHIPTISIGFNDVGRNETRDPIVSVNGHYKVCASAKSLVDTFKTGTWKDNTIFLSTWNEFSEGTYMFRTASTGFDYLENVRKVFTSDKSSHKELDVAPTESQLSRITHMYPDNHSPIRWYQFEAADTAAPQHTVKINGVTMSFTFNPVNSDDGDLIVVGEASKGFYSMLRLFYEWDRYTDKGVLTLHTYDERTLVFRVGSDKVSIDYGTVNPTSMGLWGRCRGVWYRISEFYFSSRAAMRQMTDEEYADALQKLVGERNVTAVIVDPSAASFMEVLRRRGWQVRKADNDVLSGIRLTSDCLKDGRIVICRGCADCIREMDEYVWDLNAPGDRVKKEHDHAMDDMRYFVSSVLGKKETGFTACAVERRR